MASSENPVNAGLKTPIGSFLMPLLAAASFCASPVFNAPPASGAAASAAPAESEVPRNCLRFMVFSPADNDSAATPAAPILDAQMFFLNQICNDKSASRTFSGTSAQFRAVDRQTGQNALSDHGIVAWRPRSHETKAALQS
jgi:hypothetical protein